MTRAQSCWTTSLPAVSMTAVRWPWLGIVEIINIWMIFVWISRRNWIIKLNKCQIWLMLFLKNRKWQTARLTNSSLKRRRSWAIRPNRGIISKWTHTKGKTPNHFQVKLKWRMTSKISCAVILFKLRTRKVSQLWVNWQQLKMHRRK